MFSRSFILQTLERAGKTFAQSLIAFLSTAAVIEAVDWQQALSASALATVLSVLTSVVSAPVGDKGTPSLVDEH